MWFYSCAILHSSQYTLLYNRFESKGPYSCVRGLNKHTVLCHSLSIKGPTGHFKWSQNHCIFVIYWMILEKVIFVSIIISLGKWECPCIHRALRDCIPHSKTVLSRYWNILAEKYIILHIVKSLSVTKFGWCPHMSITNVSNIV